MPDRDAARLAVAERRYRRLLRVLPAPFRRRAGGELEAMFRAGYRRRQTAAWPVRAGFWVRMMADLVVTAAAERAAPRRSAARSAEQASETGRMARGSGRGFSRWLPGADSVRHGARRLAFSTYSGLRWRAAASRTPRRTRPVARRPQW